MCKSIDMVDEKLKILINDILKGNKEYTLKDIYDALEKDNINAKRYRSGVTIKDYFDLLISNEILEYSNKKYMSPDSVNQVFSRV